jgi:hypothetical protein
MTDHHHSRACRLRTKVLLKIAAGIYDDGERFLIEHAIGHLEVLAIAAGPLSAETEAMAMVAGPGSGQIKR